MNTLPNEILLKIFRYFSTHELVSSVSRVCTKWHEISKDISLWITVDCSHFPKRIATRSKVLKRYLKPTTQEIKFGPNFSPTDSFVGTINQLCPCLNTIDLSHCNLTNLNLECLPLNLEKLMFSHCKIDNMSPSWNFKFVVPIAKRKRLKELSLDYFTSVNQEILHYWELSSPNLVKLDLSGCYRLSYINIDALLSCFTKLEDLKLSNMNLQPRSFKNTENLQSLGRSTTLKRIDISHNRFLKDSDLHSFMDEVRKSTTTSSLEELNVTGPLSQYIDLGMLDILKNLPQLKSFLVSYSGNIQDLLSITKKPSWLLIDSSGDNHE